MSNNLPVKRVKLAEPTRRFYVADGSGWMDGYNSGEFGGSHFFDFCHGQAASMLMLDLHAEAVTRGQIGTTGNWFPEKLPYSRP